MNGYGLGARLLHRLALGSPLIADMSFDMEWSVFGAKAPPSHDGAHIFVAGLARAGTTILTRLLNADQDLCSLTYRDMPFVLAPNLWRKFHRDTGGITAQERAHGDGIKVDADSAEALDEVFWRQIAVEKIRSGQMLRPVALSKETRELAQRHVSLILHRYGATRYLSKNNNHLLRLDGIRTTFPKAVILIPFRHPLTHSQSLHTQHRRFCAQQARDPFTRTYMNWLGHHEFGLDHFPVDWGHGISPSHSPENIEYWLTIWQQTYAAVLKTYRNNPERLILFDYDQFCLEPETIFTRLAKALSVSAHMVETIRPATSQEAVIENSAAETDALNLHAALQALAANSL